jgi:amino acid adenylation domain-containing protein
LYFDIKLDAVTVSFVDKVVDVFGRFPDRNAFCINGKYYTYAEFQSIVNSIRHLLLEDFSGIQKFGVVVTDDIETYAAIVALLLSGRTYVPIHPHHPEDRINRIIELSEASILFAKDSRFTFSNAGTVLLDETSLQADSAALPPADVSLEEVDAYILFTSGSTGIPKGVPISYFNVDSFVESFKEVGYKVDQNDRFLQMFDLTFDLSVMSYLIPLCVGGCVYTIPDGGMKYMHVYRILTECSITVALMVPSIVAYLRPYFSEIHLPDLRYSLFCGEALNADLVDEWKACVPNAVVDNVYGPTEATIFCLTYRTHRDKVDATYNGVISIGKAMDGMEAVVVNDSLLPVEIGEKGELCLHGKQLTRGYINVERNKEAFFELDNKRFYRTGDIAFLDAVGNFFYCGRVDHQVKIQGFRVELGEIEFHLRRVSGVTNVVAIPTPVGNGLSRIVGFFESSQFDTAGIMSELAGCLPDYMIPSEFYFVNPFPLNANGKIDRGALGKTVI